MWLTMTPQKSPIKKEAKNEKSNKKDEEMEKISYAQKTKYVFKEFVLESLGEILIYPSIITKYKYIPPYMGILFRRLQINIHSKRTG